MIPFVNHYVGGHLLLARDQYLAANARGEIGSAGAAHPEELVLTVILPSL